MAHIPRWQRPCDIVAAQRALHPLVSCICKVVLVRIVLVDFIPCSSFSLGSARGASRQGYFLCFNGWRRLVPSKCIVETLFWIIQLAWTPVQNSQVFRIFFSHFFHFSFFDFFSLTSCTPCELEEIVFCFHTCILSEGGVWRLIPGALIRTKGKINVDWHLTSCALIRT